MAEAPSAFTLADLERIVAERASASPETSWTARLLAGGTPKAARKFGEEAVELVVAALAEDEAAATGEAADVLYHLLVLLRARGIPLSRVLAVLEARGARSGLAEKAARAPTDEPS
jgi:phosphoribosyl-ATP pyrophosphohydrolase